MSVERVVIGMDVVNNFVCIDVRWTGRGISTNYSVILGELDRVCGQPTEPASSSFFMALETFVVQVVVSLLSFT